VGSREQQDPVAADGRAAASAPPAPPSGSFDDIARLRSALDAAGFTAQAVRKALHAEADLLSGSHDVVVNERRLADVPPGLAAVIRLFVLELPVAVDDAGRALTEQGAQALVELGLVSEEDGVLRRAVRLVPHDHLLIASDEHGVGGANHVAGVHRPSATLAGLTVRRPVSTALDVATGNGIQALLASPHAEHVVATDVNERALAFAEFNAELNGIDNVEFRAGSFFEAAAGERFGLVVCNPPYVISPETEFVFRDSGLPGDTVSAKLVAELPTYLEEDAFGTILVSWIAGEDSTLRPRAWLEGLGCDAWILHTSTDDPLKAASQWNRPLEGTPEEFAQRVDAWLEYYARLGIEAIAYGAVVMRRRSGRGHWTRMAEFPSTRPQAASDHIQRLFAAQDFLAATPAEELVDRRFTLVDRAYLDRTAHVESGAWTETSAAVRLAEGIEFGANLDRYGAALVGPLDGSDPLRSRLPALAAELGVSEADLAGFAARLLHYLVEHGLAVASE
jgi:methylase of polypeptide subunit release factors